VYCEEFSRVFTRAPQISGYEHGKPAQQRKRTDGRLDCWENDNSNTMWDETKESENGIVETALEEDTYWRQAIWILAKEMAARR
jgi:hypothetical protein